MRALALPLALTLAPATSAAGGVIHVPADQPAIQAAIGAAGAGDEIVVAPGTYHEAVNLAGKAVWLRSAGGAAVTTIAGAGAGTPVVRCVSGEGAGTIIEGFTISGGNVPGGLGGGLRIASASPRVRSCVFVGNNAASGGAVSISGGAARLVSCAFTGNGASGQGGAVYLQQTGALLADCTFQDNEADAGGAVFNADGGATIANCTFAGNAATGDGGGLYNSGGAAAVIGCVFSGNAAGGAGGGVVNAVSTVSIANCSFNGNSAGAAGGAIFSSISTVHVANSIVWASPPGPIGSVAGVTTVEHSDVQGGFAGNGNIDLPPLFVDPAGPDDTPGTADDDLTLIVPSPCIDAGANAAYPYCHTDRAGNVRRADDPASPDCPQAGACGAAPVIDMGAFEHLGEPVLLDCNVNLLEDACEIATGLASDCNGNGQPDDCDVLGGASEDCDADGVPDECQTDCNGNGVPDGCDIAGSSPADALPIGGIEPGARPAAGPSFDCNANGVPDECDIAQVASLDCNGDGRLDQCQLAHFEVAFPATGPIGDGAPASFAVSGIPEAGVEVTFAFRALGDLGATNELLEVAVNGAFIGAVFEVGFSDCPPSAEIDTLVIAGPTFNELADNGAVVIDVLPAFSVDPNLCASSLELTLSYQAVTVVDGDGDGTADPCCPADLDADGTVSTGDLLVMLAGWGPNPGHPADLDGNGRVGTGDLLALLGAWGGCV